jgi:hypothetical protein
MKKVRWILILVLTFVLPWGMISPTFADEKAKEEAGAQEAPGLKIARLVLGTGVENREPVGVSETFPASIEKVYCFLEATDISQDTEVSFVWYHGEKEMGKTTLPLKMGSRWRTYASKNLGELKGEWKVEIRDAAGNVLKDVQFKVE